MSGDQWMRWIHQQVIPPTHLTDNCRTRQLTYSTIDISIKRMAWHPSLSLHHTRRTHTLTLFLIKYIFSVTLYFFSFHGAVEKSACCTVTRELVYKTRWMGMWLRSTGSIRQSPHCTHPLKMVKGNKLYFYPFPHFELWYSVLKM